MTILRISSATANTNTVTIGTHAQGDLLMIFGYRDASATAPTLPSGWYNLMATAASSPSLVVAWKIAASSSESSGTWTNANTLHSIVYRAGTGNIVIPTILQTNIATTTTPTFGAPAVTGTFPTNIDDYWIVGMMGMRLQWGRDLLVAERCLPTNGLKTRYKLQWGRDLLVAESRMVVSLGTPNHKCFNGAATC